jgi:hypothetical protein
MPDNTEIMVEVVGESETNKEGIKQENDVSSEIEDAINSIDTTKEVLKIVPRLSFVRMVD